MEMSQGQDRDSDRRSRMTSHHPIEVQSLRERAASQPPRSAGLDPTTSPSGHRFDHYTPLTGIPWSGSHSQSLASRVVPLGRSISLGLPQPIPVRSSSFSHERAQAFGSPHSSLRGGVFSSTFEDDESEVMSDDLSQPYDNIAELSQLYARRPHSPDNNRSRSQSLAVLRTTPSGSLAQSLQRVPLHSSWKEPTFLDNDQLSSPPRSRMSRDLRTSLEQFQPLGSGRPAIQSSGSPLRHSSIAHEFTDPTNISPFLRGGNQIFFEDGRFRDLWATGNSHKDEWGTGSGNTSRRHSVSVVQPRRGTLGISPGEQSGLVDDDATGRSEHRGRLDSDLSRTMDRLNLNLQPDLADRSTASRTSDVFHDRESSLGPTRRDAHVVSFENQLQLNSAHQHTAYDQLQSASAPWRGLDGDRYSQAAIVSPTAPGLHGQPAALNNDYHLHGNHRSSGAEDQGIGQRDPTVSRPSTQNNAQNMPGAELGRGIPLHAIPSGYPLYIVEFKAGRTDLFFTGPDGPSNLRVGDLVIVEADRGRDLGKIVNDTITHNQIEEWQNSSAKHHDEGPVSPGGSPSKKELNPKRIYGKATSHDTQFVA
jgi:hypothetical protein